MNKWILFTMVFSISISSFAIPSKTFNCKNIDGLPDNVYKFTMTSIDNGIQLPIVESSRFGKAPNSSTNKFIEYKMKGFGTITSVEGVETVLFNSLRFEFEGDELKNCKK